MENLLISACLLGAACRYDGREGKVTKIAELCKKYNLVPVCPEIYGGLPTPRTPSERVGDKVLMRDGADVTENYLRGAIAAYKLCEQLGCRKALLKERSPSCGSGEIYDGTFSGKLVTGDGVTAEYLKKRGITVFGESEVDKLL
ncbi:MAG: DUF523 domain-containing protein [Clostridia bacterium]|nr:DUF523 domain-containing protein [Clostridia bacterium]